MLKELRERVRRFEKLNREYNDYKRFRERILRQGYSLTSGIIDVRFTCTFIRKLIDEAKDLALPKEDFDEDLLE